MWHNLKFNVIFDIKFDFFVSNGVLVRMNTSVIQSTINAIDKPVIFLNLDYTIQAVNDSYRELYKSNVITGQSKCYEISHNSTDPCDKHGEACPLKLCLENDKSNSVVHIHHTELGKQFCDILMKPVKDDNGITIGFLEIIEDISFASADMKKNKMVGESHEFRQMLKHVNRAAKSDIAVLLQGQTGTGKELVAQALHDGSDRKEKPFVIIECTGLNETLFESELFGHEKGAFTGATHAKKGLVEIANGGTVFFDEIGDVPLNMQVKLLRLIETRTFRSVGGLKQKKADFRFLSASHKNLKQLVQQGRFREDLYYRIAGFPIHLPALSSRKEDIPLLVNYFLNHSEFNHKEFSSAALTAIQNYSFPGNIRELKNIVEQSSLLSDEDIIEKSDLPDYVFEQSNAFSDKWHSNLISLEKVESDYLKMVFKNKQDSIEEVAGKLDVSVRTLYRKLSKYSIKLSS